MDTNAILSKLPVNPAVYRGPGPNVYSPVDGSMLGSVKADTTESVQQKIAASLAAFHVWRDVPAPKRGELVRLFGEKLRQHKEALAGVVTLECGKVLTEARGEVQEMIDICDFAVGLSRQLYGLTIASERKDHVMQENWLPLGPVGIISAFNFPVAVWAWNAALALVCGDSILWKPSEKTPFSAIVSHLLLKECYGSFTKSTGIVVPEGLSEVILGDASVGEAMTMDRRVALVSATGSTRMGQIVGPKVAGRFGKSLLELGGNNAVIVSNKANLELALSSLIFGAAGTAGQRCTTTRRILVHKDIYPVVSEKLTAAWKKLAGYVGNPFESGSLIGPLIDKASFERMQEVLKQVTPMAESICGGQRILEIKYPNAYYVTPALVFMKEQTALVKEETFAPIAYVLPYATLEEAVTMNNDVAQGLSSAIFTTDITEAEYFKRYSDCGIANVNIGTSGAEIGGAFGGEKETGGGRESGSDAWKNYMRRQTSTTYFGIKVPELAQGVTFDLAP